MAENKKKIAIGVGATAAVAGIILLLTMTRGWILGLEWKRGAVPDEWHTFTVVDPLPDFKDIIHRFKVKNRGDETASFRMAYYIPPPEYGPGWRYSTPVVIEPGEEAYIEWTLWAGRAGTYTTTWHLFREEDEVASIKVVATIIEGD